MASCHCHVTICPLKKSIQNPRQGGTLMARKRSPAPDFLYNFGRLWRFDLTRTGSRRGTCILQAVSWIEYRTLVEEPACVCPVNLCRRTCDQRHATWAQASGFETLHPPLIDTVDHHSYAQRYQFLARQGLLILCPTYPQILRPPSQRRKPSQLHWPHRPRQDDRCGPSLLIPTSIRQNGARNCARLCECCRTAQRQAL
jgi:hypothetical protein